MVDSVKMMGRISARRQAAAWSPPPSCAPLGRMELDLQEEIFRSDMAFTPLLPNDRLDMDQVERLLDGWLEAGQVKNSELFGGGALLTGLTAQKENAAVLVRLIRRRLGDALIATADDPCLESWLAFMGNSRGCRNNIPTKAFSTWTSAAARPTSLSAETARSCGPAACSSAHATCR